MTESFTERLQRIGHNGKGKSASMLVGAIIPSTYTVTVPKKITLQKDIGGNSIANYTVKVKGDIAANERLSVGLKKTAITMSQRGKEDVTATARINQNNLDFDDIDDIGYDIGGDVAATKLTAGTWNGNVEFVVNLDRLLDAGLYDENFQQLAEWNSDNASLATDYTASNYNAENSKSGYNAVNKYSATNVVLAPTSIGAHSFYNCSSLNSVLYDKKLSSSQNESVGEVAFGNCTNLTTVSLPQNITSIGRAAFTNCTSLSDILMPGVSIIEQAAFSGDTALKSIDLSDNIADIGEAAFQRTGLTSVVIPDSVTYVKNQVFLDCSELTEVTLPQYLTMYAPAFDGCTKLKEITYKGTTYTSKSALKAAMAQNGVTTPDRQSVGDYSCDLFAGTGLSD